MELYKRIILPISPNKYFNPAFNNSINQKFREKRFSFFKNLLSRIQSDKTIQILDIGGTEKYWERMDFPKDENVHITLLNLDFVEAKRKQIFTCIQGDACNLSEFKDQQFDIVFSNSVIEHLSSMENQKKMADEVRRVGTNYFVQTPNRYFPIEPHWLLPFFQFLPFGIKVYLTKSLNLGHYKKTNNKDAAIERVQKIKLLSEKEMKSLFPEGKVYREYFLKLLKSITLYHFPRP